MGQFVAKTKEYFLEKAIAEHGDKYDYSLVDYVGAHIKVKIICKEHGVFEQTPTNHYKGNGCPKCALKRIGRRGKHSKPSGHYGIVYHPVRDTWRVNVFENGKRNFIGSFHDLGDAIKAQQIEMDRIYGDCKVEDLEGEIWIPIKETDGTFLISNKGRIKTINYLKRGIEQLHVLNINPHGYISVILNKHSYLVHRLVAECFIGYNKKQVNHKDGNRQNNCVENLEYVSNRTNVCHGFIALNGKRYIGAHKRKRDGRYTTSIKIGGKSIWLGAYDTPQEASERYLRALLEYGLIEEHKKITEILQRVV